MAPHLVRSILMLLLMVGCSTPTKERDEERAYLHAQMGLGHFRNGSFNRALGQYLEAEKADSQNEAIQNQLGLTYFMLKKPAQALQHFERALNLRPAFTEAKNNKARVLIEMGRYQEARSLLQQVLEDLTYPNHHKARTNLGLLEFERGNFEESKRHFLTALKSDREDCMLYTYYGRSLYELSEHRAAVPVFERAVQVCKNTPVPEPLYFSGMNFYKLGDTVKAKARFEEVVELYPLADASKGAVSMLKLLETR